MRVKALVIGYVFAIALLMFAQRRPAVTQRSGFRAVINLSTPASESPVDRIGRKSPQIVQIASHSRAAEPALETRLEAPAAFTTNLWTADQIPPQRLVAPLVVLDVRTSVARDPDYQIGVMDIANWERRHGEIPLGSVVMALTGSEAGSGRFGYSADATKFLIEGRNVVGLGIDASNIAMPGGDSRQDSAVPQYALSHSTYLLDNVANLEMAPENGGVVVVAPAKSSNRTTSPVRILAFAR